MARAGGEGRIRGPRPFVPVGDTNQDKRGAFCPDWCPGWCLQPGQNAPVPPLARLAVGPGTKATYCPGSKGCRDKWPGTKTYSVVVTPTFLTIALLCTHRTHLLISYGKPISYYQQLAYAAFIHACPSLIQIFPYTVINVSKFARRESAKLSLAFTVISPNPNPNPMRCLI